MTLKRTTISLSSHVLDHYRQQGRNQRRSLSSLIEERLKDFLSAPRRPVSTSRKKGGKAA